MTTLLAKSPRGGRTLTLHQHLLDTEQAASALFRQGTRWAHAYLRFFKLPEAEHARFLRNLRIAALFHDLGKANDGFLGAVTSKRFVAQSLRHEHLSGIVLAHPAVRRWLAACADVDIDVILAAVLSHHLKAAQSGPWQVLNARSAAPTRLHLDDPQIISTLARIADVAERHPRYRLEAVAGEAEARQRVLTEARAGRRVLWVVYTVARCQRLARRLTSAFPQVLVYHSRFRLEDRQRRHRETVDAYRAPAHGEPMPAIAVTTQVCEMSLDLDADVLVTEHAPISSLVQRLGRANRHLRRGADFRAQVITYPAESELPYERDDLAAAAGFLSVLADRDVSQRDLAEGLAAHSPPGRQASGETRFLDGGYFATPGTLRDSDDAGAPVILDLDLPRFRELHRHREPTDGLHLTVPRRFARPAEEAELPTWLMLADGDRYDPTLGFRVEEDMT